MPQSPHNAQVFRSHSKLLVWILCIALVVLRVGAVHVHFCADGNEPATSVHLGDNGLDDLDHPKGVGLDASVFDSDLSVSGDFLVKNLDFDLPTIAAAFTLLLFFVAIVRIVPADWGPALVRISDPTRLRPPLRGPPA
jgi:hypothetical protein